MWPSVALIRGETIVPVRRWARGSLDMHRLSRYTVTRNMDLRPASYFVLASLLDGPLHGYAIAARAEELSGGEVRLTAGTLYGALERMTGQGGRGIGPGEAGGGR